MEMKLQQHGIAENPNRIILKTKTDEYGGFEFRGVPRENLVLFVDKRNYCWDLHYHKVDTSLSTNDHLHRTFTQTGWEWSYETDLIFEATLKSADGKDEKAIKMHRGEGIQCYNHKSGVAELVLSE